jgi:hypothetical protein
MKLQRLCCACFLRRCMIRGWRKKSVWEIGTKIKDAFVFWKVVSGKSLFKLFCVCLPLEKLINGKHFSVKGKFGLVFKKVFSFYFGWKTLSRSCENFRNIILFVDCIKFGPQTFDCYIYIYFVLNICFSISSLRI